MSKVNQKILENHSSILSVRCEGPLIKLQFYNAYNLIYQSYIRPSIHYLQTLSISCQKFAYNSYR